MNTRKVNIIAICVIAASTLTISQPASAQIRLGAVSTAHLSSAASLNTPSVSNALRASSATAVSSAGREQVSGASVGRQIKGKTTTAVNQPASTGQQAEESTMATASATEAAAVSSVGGVKNGAHAGAASASYARVNASAAGTTTASVRKQ